MNSDPAAIYLRESLEELCRALEHLRYSAQTCGVKLDSSAPITEANLEKLEAFTSRFARVVDLITKRVLRAIDQFEWFDPGTLLDIANRAEKRGIIDSVDWLRELKDTRNRISHDYAGDSLPEILIYCREELPRLFDSCSRIQSYGESLLSR